MSGPSRVVEVTVAAVLAVAFAALVASLASSGHRRAGALVALIGAAIVIGYVVITNERIRRARRLR